MQKNVFIYVIYDVYGTFISRQISGTIFNWCLLTVLNDQETTETVHMAGPGTTVVVQEVEAEVGNEKRNGDMIEHRENDHLQFDEVEVLNKHWIEILDDDQVDLEVLFLHEMIEIEKNSRRLEMKDCQEVHHRQDHLVETDDLVPALHPLLTMLLDIDEIIHQVIVTLRIMMVHNMGMIIRIGVVVGEVLIILEADINNDISMALIFVLMMGIITLPKELLHQQHLIINLIQIPSQPNQSPKRHQQPLPIKPR